LYSLIGARAKPRADPLPLPLPLPLPAPAAALALTLLTACGALGGTPQITRTVGGHSRTGAFVSPYQYEHFLRGELANLHGDLATAAEEYRAARGGSADDPLLIARLADVLDRLDRHDEAMALLRQGDDDFPHDESIWLTRGRIHQRHGRLDEAAEAFGQAAAAAPASEDGPLALAGVLRAQSQADEADAVLERYLGHARGAGAARARLRLAIERDDPLAAADAVRALLEAAPARASEVRDAALSALRHDHPELALRLLAALPDTREDRPLRLRALLEARAFDDAEALLAGWMPSGPEERIVVAEGYLAIGQPQRALELAQVSQSDDGPRATLIVGRALAAAGQPGRAAEVLSTIAPGSRAWPAAPIALAHVLRDAGRPAAAAEVLARAQARAPSEALQVELADARREAGRPDDALAALDGASPRLAAARARLLDALGRHEEAATAYARLPVDDPAVPRADRVRAQAERAITADQMDRARELLREQVARAPEDRLAAARLEQLGSD